MENLKIIEIIDLEIDMCLLTSPCQHYISVKYENESIKKFPMTWPKIIKLHEDLGLKIPKHHTY